MQDVWKVHTLGDKKKCCFRMKNATWSLRRRPHFARWLLIPGFRWEHWWKGRSLVYENITFPFTYSRTTSWQEQVKSTSKLRIKLRENEKFWQYQDDWDLEAAFEVVRSDELRGRGGNCWNLCGHLQKPPVHLFFSSEHKVGLCLAALRDQIWPILIRKWHLGIPVQEV